MKITQALEVRRTLDMTFLLLLTVHACIQKKLCTLAYWYENAVIVILAMPVENRFTLCHLLE